MSHPDPKRLAPPYRVTQPTPSPDARTARTDLKELFAEVSDTQERPPAAHSPASLQDEGIEPKGPRQRARTHAGLGPPASYPDEPDPPTPSIADAAAQVKAAQDAHEHGGATPPILKNASAVPQQSVPTPETQNPTAGAPSLRPDVTNLLPRSQTLRPMSLRPGAVAHHSLPPRARGASLAYLLGVALLSAVVASGVAVAAVLLAGPGLMRALYAGSEASAASSQTTNAPVSPRAPVGAKVEIPLVERARAGDVAAIRELEQRPQDQRSIAETLALAAGRTVRKKAALGELRAALERDPKLGDNLETIRLLREQARDKEVAPEALGVMASLRGPIAADLIYEVWVSDPFRTETTRLAEELAYTDEVRKKASPALGIALDLRRASTCADIADVLPRAAQDADQRSLHLLARLLKYRKCGLADDRECYRCLKKNGASLQTVIKAARGRPPPKW